MAWTPTEDFDSYSAGVSISGDSGGSGWSTNWTLGAAPATTENAPTGMSGKALKSNGYCYRSFTSINPTTDGTMEFSFKMMGENTNGSANFGISQTGVAGRLGILFDTDGHIYNLYGTPQDFGAYVANQVYTIKIKFGHASGKYAISIDGGAYSSDISLNGSSPWTMDTIFSDASGVGAKYYWYDAIGNAAVTDLSVSVSDAITVSESVTVFVQGPDINISVNDPVTVSESIEMDFPVFISVFDTVTVSESVSMDNSQLGDISVNDTVAVTESITTGGVDLGGISVFDSIVVSESVTYTRFETFRGVAKMRSKAQSFPLAMDDVEIL